MTDSPMPLLPRLEFRLTPSPRPATVQFGAVVARPAPDVPPAPTPAQFPRPTTATTITAQSPLLAPPPHIVLAPPSIAPPRIAVHARPLHRRDGMLGMVVAITVFVTAFSALVAMAATMHGWPATSVVAF